MSKPVSKPERTAGVMVQIFPAGHGRVTYEVLDLGPQSLTPQEIVRVLRGAADLMEEKT